MKTKDDIYRDMDRWEDEVVSRSSKISGDSSFVVEEFGHASHKAALDEASLPPSPDSFFGGVKSAALSAMARDGIGSVVALNMAHQQKMILESISNLESLESSAAALSDIIVDAPAQVKEKNLLNQALETSQRLSKLPQPPQSTSNVPSLIESIAPSITPESVREFMEENPSMSDSAFHLVGQNVHQLRDNYYRVSVGGSPPESDDESSPVTFSDSSGSSIKSLAGYQDVSINASGDIVVGSDRWGFEGGGALASSEEETLRMDRPANAERSRISLSEPISPPSVKDDFRFEMWACIVLNLADRIYSSCNQAIDILYKSAHAFDILGGILRNKPIDAAIRSLQDDAVRAVSEMSSAAIDLGLSVGESMIGDRLDGVFGYMGKIPTPSRPPGTMCGAKKHKYCSVRYSVERYEEFLMGEWSAAIKDLGIDIDAGYLEGVVNIESILNEPHEEYMKVFAILDKLKAKSLDLKDEVCAWVTKRMRGKPRSLGDVEQLLVLAMPAMNILFGVLGGFISQLSKSEELVEMESKLRSLGLTSAADKIAQGDIVGLAQSYDVTSTTAGEVADFTKEYSIKTRSRRSQVRLMRISNAARAKDEQMSTEHKVRGRMRERLRMNSDVESVKSLKRDAKEEIDRVEAEG